MGLVGCCHSLGQRNDHRLIWIVIRGRGDFREGRGDAGEGLADLAEGGCGSGGSARVHGGGIDAGGLEAGDFVEADGHWGERGKWGVIPGQ